MHFPRRGIHQNALAMLAVFLLLGAGPGCHDAQVRAPLPASQGGPPPDQLRLRTRLLARMDTDIDAQATRAHLQARLMLNDLMPIAYLGLDADPVDGGMMITRVYPDTGASDAGLRKGDVIRAVAGAPTASREAFGPAIRSFRPGDVVALQLDRDGAAMNTTAIMGVRPEEDEDEAEQIPELAAVVAPLAPVSMDFEADAPGGVPEALQPVLGGHGREPHWSVVKDGSGARLRQLDTDTTGIRFPMAIVRGAAARDVQASVRFRFVAGKVDRAAGLVVRYQDPGNYIVARCNAVEGDLRIFRVVNGIRRTIPGAVVKASVDDDHWHFLTLRADGPLLVARVDDAAEASGYDTYLGHGGMGVWTKSDATSDFDDLKFEAIRPPPPKWTGGWHTPGSGATRRACSPRGRLDRATFSPLRFGQESRRLREHGRSATLSTVPPAAPLTPPPVPIGAPPSPTDRPPPCPRPGPRSATKPSRSCRR